MHAAKPDAQTQACLTLEGTEACPGCGLEHLRVQPPAGCVARCSRCETVLARGHTLDVNGLLALTVASTALLLIAQFGNLLIVRLQGPVVSTSFPAAIVDAWLAGAEIVAVLSAVTALLAPAAYLGLRLYLHIPLLWQRAAPAYRQCLQALEFVSRWNTVEVLSVAAMLSLVRLHQLAEATPGPALYALGALALLLAWIESASLDSLRAALQSRDADATSASSGALHAKSVSS